MEDTLITFETAKLAKEKGFDIKTKYSWYVPDNSKPIIEKHKPDGLYYLSCPTQSLLTKWLREKYDIDVIINTYRNQNQKYYKYFISEKSKNVIKSEEYYNTYEDALEIGLQEALKSI